MFRYSIVIPFKNSTTKGVGLEGCLSNCSEITAKMPIEIAQKYRSKCHKNADFVVFIRINCIFAIFVIRS